VGFDFQVHGCNGLSEQPGKKNRLMHVLAHFGQQVKALTRAGTCAITELKKCLEEQLKEDFPIEPKKEASERSLSASYHGLRMRFCVEIQMIEPAMAKLVAFYWTYDTEPKEIRLVERIFNHEGTFTANDWPEDNKQLDKFATFFMLDVFKAALEKGLVLRP
jgi:hypothetical protein